MLKNVLIRAKANVVRLASSGCSVFQTVPASLAERLLAELCSVGTYGWPNPCGIPSADTYGSKPRLLPEPPPQVDRGSKPPRFSRSAQERLFGSPGGWCFPAASFAPVNQPALARPRKVVCVPGDAQKRRTKLVRCKNECASTVATRMRPNVQSSTTPFSQCQKAMTLVDRAPCCSHWRIEPPWLLLRGATGLLRSTFVCSLW